MSGCQAKYSGLSQDEAEMFLSHHVSLGDIEARGWRRKVNESGNVIWHHLATGRKWRPEWLRQMLAQAEEFGRDSVRQQILGALGCGCRTERSK
jgi:hypothetical protein